MNKIILIMGIGLSSFLLAAEPDESGIGGTGVSNPDVREFIFNRPDVPDIVTDIIEVPSVSDDLPDISSDIGSADLIDIPSAIESNIAPSDALTMPPSVDK